MLVKTIHSRQFYILYITLPPDPGILITSRDEEPDMILKSLTERLILKTITGSTSVDITNLDTDSREIRPGGLFVCVPGFHVDGHDYARQRYVTALLPLWLNGSCRDYQEILHI